MWRWLRNSFHSDAAPSPSAVVRDPDANKNVDGANFLLLWLGALQFAGESPVESIQLEPMLCWLLVYSAADHLAERVSDVDPKKIATSAASAYFGDHPTANANAIERTANNWQRLRNLHPEAVQRYTMALRAMFDDKTAKAVLTTAAMTRFSSQEFQVLMMSVPKTATRPVIDALFALRRQADEASFQWV